MGGAQVVAAWGGLAASVGRVELVRRRRRWPRPWLAGVFRAYHCGGRAGTPMAIQYCPEKC